MAETQEGSIPSTPESVKAVAQTQEGLTPDLKKSEESISCETGRKLFVIGESVTRAAEARPNERGSDQPIYRPLKIFALDPSVSRLEGATAVVNVPYEQLHDGPCGYFFKVDNATAVEKPSRPPLNLDDPNILINNGINPSTSDERFHEQMVYAVCSVVHTAFRTALGRHLVWGFNRPTDRTRLLIRPRAFDKNNSHYDRETGELCFGFYQSQAKDYPGKVYACLSHDTVAHEVSHALLDGLRAHFSLPTSPDVLALHEGFADLVALFQHFSYEQVVRAAIRKSRGDLTRSDLLTDIARQLGRTRRDSTSALRSAIDYAAEKPAEGEKKILRVYDQTLEAHELGSVLVFAVFEAFINVFRRKTERLMRLATGGTGRLRPGEISADLQAVLAEKASKLASQFLTMCIRAVDYCPPVDITFGEYLRAVITADRDLVPDDPWAYREAWVDSFRRYKIFPNFVPDLSEESLLWLSPNKQNFEIERIEELAFAELKFDGDPAWPAGADELERQACVLGKIVTTEKFMPLFGLAREDNPDLKRKPNVVSDNVDPPKIQSIRSSRRIGPSGQVVFDIVAEVTQRRIARIPGSEETCNFYGGSTIIIDPRGAIRYVIKKRVTDNQRLTQQIEFLNGQQGAQYRDSFYHQTSTKPNFFKMLHDPPPTSKRRSRVSSHLIRDSKERGDDSIIHRDNKETKMSLDHIDHIVVLMLENRSFDHMLGYLKREGGRQDIDGLTGNEENFHDGTAFPSQRMASPIMNGDPCHEWDCVKEQLDGDNGGFIDNYARVVASNPEFIMHYFNADDVPVYDHLAKEFCICDRWFSAIPGATQPNRAYALAGTSDGIKDNFTSKQLLSGSGFAGRTIFEFLPETVSWSCYSHDIAGLRFFKKFRTKLVPQIDKIDKFFQHAQSGTLSNVSWIDPDFGIAVYPGPPNDDHPPHDMRHTQNLVSRVYNALLNSPNWSKTLLIVVYDEHGGFYDHVSPRSFTPVDSNPEFTKYGVRVPAFLISPWVGRQVAYGSDVHGHQPQEVLFDHTSILRTILRRFCTDAGGAVPGMTARVDAANDLSALLTEQQPRTDCTAAPSIPNVPVALKDRFLMESENSELQDSLNVMVAQARADGVPPDKL